MSEEKNKNSKDIIEKIDHIEKENVFAEDIEAKKLAIESAKKYLEFKQNKKGE